MTNTTQRMDCPPYLIALTASPTSDVRAICQSAGMNAFIGKPFRAIELQDTVGKFAKQSLSVSGSNT